MNQAGSNSQKSLAGKSFDNTIRVILEKLKEEGVISSFEKKRNFAHKGFDYQKQYLANFVVKTLNDKYIIIRRTTSCRGDRAKIAYYDLNGVKNNSEYSESIIASIFLVPDEAADTPSFKNEKKNFLDKNVFLPVTHFFSLGEFIGFLENYAHDVRSLRPLTAIQDTSLNQDQMITSAMSVGETGSYYGKRGNEYELEICSMLKSRVELDRMLAHSPQTDPRYSLIVNKITADNNILLDYIRSISSSNTVDLLANGGKPKTDIIVKIQTTETEYTSTLSIKRSTQKHVSCHDYPAEAFIRVLQCEGGKLAKYLELFQKEPGYKRFEEALSHPDSVEEFSKLLTQQERTFNEWVLTGKHDTENLTNPEHQVAEYCLISSGVCVESDQFGSFDLNK